MAISAEQLNIILSARDKEFTKAMDRSQKRVDRFSKASQKSLTQTSKNFSVLGRSAKRLAPMLAAVFSARAMANLASGAADIGKLAALAGTTAVELQLFSAGAKTVGLEMAKTADIIKDVNDKVGDFISTGGGSMADFFENIAPAVGVTAEQFAKLSGPQALQLYVSSLEKANLSQAEMTFYMEALASDSTALLPLLRNNGKEMSTLGDEAQRTGRILNDDAVSGARELEKEAGELGTAIKTSFTEAIVENKDELLLLVKLITETVIPVFAALISTIGEASRVYGLYTGTGGDGGPPAVTDPTVRSEDVSGANALGGGDTSSSGLFYVDDDGNVQEYGTGTPSIAGITSPAPPIKIKGVVRKGLDDEPPTGGGKSAVDEVKELQERYRDLIGTLDEAVGRSNEYKETQTMLALALERGAISQDDFNKGMALAKERFEQATFEASELASIMQTVEGSMESAFMSMIDGTASAEDAFKSMAGQIIKELYRVLVVQKLVGAISGFIGGIGSAAPATSLRPQLRPMASGGAVQAGQQYMTGEHGRELFVPSQNGRILSAAQTNNMTSGGGGGDGVTVIQNNTFGNGVSRAEVNAMLPKMVEATKAAVADAKLRGGSYGRSFA